MLAQLFPFLLLLLQLTLGFSGLSAGLMLFLLPDGSGLQLNIAMLERTPFRDYTIPGLLLLWFIGVLPLVTVVGLVRKDIWPGLEQLNLFRDQYWAWSFSLYTGLITLVWIMVQQLMIGYLFVQSAVQLVALLILFLSLMPPLIARYNR